MVPVSIGYFLTKMLQGFREMERNLSRVGETRVWRMTGKGEGEEGLLKD